MSKLEIQLIEMANAVLDLPKTNDPIGKPIDDAKAEIKTLMLDLINEVDADERHPNGAIIEMRQKVREL